MSTSLSCKTGHHCEDYLHPTGVHGLCCQYVHRWMTLLGGFLVRIYPQASNILQEFLSLDTSFTFDKTVVAPSKSQVQTHREFTTRQPRSPGWSCMGVTTYDRVNVPPGPRKVHVPGNPTERVSPGHSPHPHGSFLVHVWGPTHRVTYALAVKFSPSGTLELLWQDPFGTVNSKTRMFRVARALRPGGEVSTARAFLW